MLSRRSCPLLSYSRPSLREDPGLTPFLAIMSRYPDLDESLPRGRRCCTRRDKSFNHLLGNHALVMSAFTQKQNQAQQRASFNITRSSNVAPLASRQGHPILQLQRAIGNQAVQRLLQAELIRLEAHDRTQDTTRFAHYVSQIPVYSKAPVKLQAKLTDNPGDVYEQEAERVSEQVCACPSGGYCILAPVADVAPSAEARGSNQARIRSVYRPSTSVKATLTSAKRRLLSTE